MFAQTLSEEVKDTPFLEEVVFLTRGHLYRVIILLCPFEVGRITSTRALLCQLERMLSLSVRAKTSFLCFSAARAHHSKSHMSCIRRPNLPKAKDV